MARKEYTFGVRDKVLINYIKVSEELTMENPLAIIHCSKFEEDEVAVVVSQKLLWKANVIETTHTKKGFSVPKAVTTFLKLTNGGYSPVTYTSDKSFLKELKQVVHAVLNEPWPEGYEAAQVRVVCPEFK